MTLKIIEGILKDVTGVDIAARGTSMLFRAVGGRMNKLAINKSEQYADLILASDKELQTLIDELMVTETWFFRDRQPFYYLAEFVQQDWLERKSDRPLRVLSVPCATGEEPYSIAMVLMQSGLGREQFQIDAVDISIRALRYAKRAVFGKHSFRGDTKFINQQFFSKKQNGTSVKDVVRNKVNFEHVNFWNESFPGQRYDIIFCRNLMIYFDQSTQEKAVKKLYGMIEPKGLLFVGSAETGCISGTLFNPLNKTGAFVYCENSLVEKMSSNDEVNIAENTNESADVVGLGPYTEGQRKSSQEDTAYGSAIVKVNLSNDQVQRYELEQAQQHLDEGSVEEAAIICRDHLKRFPNSAQAYYLLGQCIELDGLGKAAVNLYRRAICIEPKHYQALKRLVALLEQQGDVVAASIFRNRAQRIILGDSVKKVAPQN